MNRKSMDVISRWLGEDSTKITYIGKPAELLSSLKNLQGIDGYDALENHLIKLLSRKNHEEVWEEIEHGFAVAKEASNYVVKNYKVGLEESLGQKDQKKADFRVYINNRWVYFEVKVSSMFPGEKIFLDKVLKPLRKKLPSLSFPYSYILVFRFSENDVTLTAPSLFKELKKISLRFQHKHQNIKQDIYPFLNGDAAVLLVRDISVKKLRKLLARCTDLMDVINFEWITDMIMERGYFVIAIDKNIPRFKGNVFQTVDNDSMFIGRLATDFEDKRTKIILEKSLNKAPKGNPCVVVLYGREIIFKNTLSENIIGIFKENDRNNFKEVSALLLDLEKATSSLKKSIHERTFIENPYGLYRLTGREIKDIVDSFQPKKLGVRLQQAGGGND